MDCKRDNGFPVWDSPGPEGDADRARPCFRAPVGPLRESDQVPVTAPDFADASMRVIAYDPDTMAQVVA